MRGTFENILLAALAGQAAAQKGYYFVLGGGGPPLVLERVDPVQAPGRVPSNHVHSIVGGNGFNASMDFSTAQSSTCSTISVKADKSNYWMPNLYFAAKNGSFIRVPEKPEHKIYYKYGKNGFNLDTDITEFPKEHRMLAGNMFLRSDPGDADDGAGIHWTCHGNSTVAASPATRGFPKGYTTCPGGFAVGLSFPTCWNGKQFNISDPYAHMAFSKGDGLPGCPATHRVARFPRIFIEYWFNVNSFDGLYNSTDNPWVLSMGDPTGYGFHADFLNGWDEGVLNAAMKTCTPGNTGNPPLSDASCFGNFSGTYTSTEMANCKQQPLLNEDVGWTVGVADNGKTRGGVLSALPGCNPIQPGPQNAVIMTNCTRT